MSQNGFPNVWIPVCLPNHPMKRSHLITLFILLTAAPAFSQERQRFFDNFDSSNGVKVHGPNVVTLGPVVNPKTTANTAKSAINKKLVQKTAQTQRSEPLVVAPRVTRMSVSDGLATRELSPVEFNRLKMATSSQMRGFTTGDALIDSYIVDSSRRYAIDPLLIYSQMHQESSFKLSATSNKGASGLMQLMPATARRLGVTNIYDAKQNIEGGVKYMRMLLDMFDGDVSLALAGYNAGEGAVMKYGNQIPPYNETREYVRRISARYGEISDPNFTRTIKRVSNSTAAKLEQNVARPLTVYEPGPVAIRLADGRMRLVNQ